MLMENLAHSKIFSLLSQNRRQKVFNSGLCVSLGELCIYAEWLGIPKIDKNYTDL